MLELLLTRIFSVTMWYHFAFMAISVAVFGMTAGALVVYLLPTYFKAERSYTQIAQASLLFAVSTLVCFYLQTQIRALPSISAIGMASLFLTYLVTAVPFVFAGIAVCLALTRFPQAVGKLYAADLAGAAFACLLLSPTLIFFGGPSSLIACSALAALAAFVFSLGQSRKLFFSSLAAFLLLAAFVPLNMQYKFVHLTWLKGFAEREIRLEKWNSFSRIRVYDWDDKPYTWALSSKCPGDPRVRQLFLDIDSNAGTVLTAFDGDFSKLDFLKYDLTNLVNYLIPNARVAIIGVGGGRDVLSALLFNPKQVVGIELNDNILSLLRNEFSSFTGNLFNRDPQVRLVNDEARSYIARSNEKFNIIQISLIDTWAATSAGAFVLTENSLYTMEAWKIFLAHLDKGGILSCCRWYHYGRPAELYRLVSLATASLEAAGIDDPSKHLALLGKRIPDRPGVGVLLLSPDGFTDEQIAKMVSESREKDWEILLRPGFCADENLKSLLGKKRRSFVNSYRLNISPPTDDSPFFFQMARLTDWNHLEELWLEKSFYQNLYATFALATLLITVTALSSACLIFPLLLTCKNFSTSKAAPYFFYFCAIGFGFMFIELSQMQRLTVFLGHPSNSLLVVLFTLLLTGGIGSYLSAHFNLGSKKHKTLQALILLLFLILLLLAFITPAILSSFENQANPIKIAIAVALLGPAGLAMGMPFPLGMREAAGGDLKELTPWFWGLNGASSVFASVLSICISMCFGISAAFLAGVLSYFAAYLASLLFSKTSENS